MNHVETIPTRWLAFDLNVLRRVEFASVAMPFTPDPALGVYLKRRKVRVLSNDVLRSSWTRSVALIQNNEHRLSDDEVNVVLDDIYVPGNRLQNPALRERFGETDAWWFDNARRNIERLESGAAAAIASHLVMAVGDYALSFTPETRELRRPLSNVFRRLWTILPEPVDNGHSNTCQNSNPGTFIAENPADLLFLRLPPTGRRGTGADRSAWREEWVRGSSDFWSEVETARSGTLGMQVETKSQYLRLLEELLLRASNIRHWAIAHVETGFVATQEIVELVNGIRSVDAVYTKDFSELTGTKAVIIKA